MKDEKLAPGPSDISRTQVVQELRSVVHLRYPSEMDVLKMISELRQEREQIGEGSLRLNASRKDMASSADALQPGCRLKRARLSDAAVRQVVRIKSEIQDK